jgi:hypothetical protein
LRRSTAPLFVGEETSIYVVERRVELPVSAPSDTVLGDLQKGAEAFQDLPFPRLPWVQRGDLEIEVDFTLANLDTESHQVAVTVNGFNEFDEYRPAIVVVDEQPTIDYAQWERLYDLGPKQRISRTIREDDFDEMAVDLATVVNGAPNSNEVVFFENKSSSDARSRAYVPAVIPGLVGFRIGLRAGAPTRIDLVASVRIRDVRGLLPDKGELHFVAEPDPFVPVRAAEN